VAVRQATVPPAAARPASVLNSAHDADHDIMCGVVHRGGAKLRTRRSPRPSRAELSTVAVSNAAHEARDDVVCGIVHRRQPTSACVSADTRRAISMPRSSSTNIRTMKPMMKKPMRPMMMAATQKVRMSGAVAPRMVAPG
jgi:hypothetical protein